MLIPFKQLFERWNVKCTGILHCGASTAQERFVYSGLGINRVVWVEAIPDVCQEMSKNIQTFKDNIAICACISDEDNKEVVFNISNNEAQSSSFLELAHHNIIHPEVSYVNKLILKTHRLDSLFVNKREGIISGALQGINFGNLDLQGTELLALKGMGVLINQFDYFYIEVNKKETYKGCALVDDIDSFLSAFERVETGVWVADTWTDAFYIRKTLL